MRRARVAHANGQLRELAAVVGQHVRLQIEHDLQPMLELAEEAVVVFEHRPLLVREAAGFLEAGDRVERVAGANFGQRAAVEQLQELDDELDVANAAVAGFDVAQVAAFAFGALLDAALERLDAGDIGEAEVPAIDPRLEAVEQLAAEVEVAGDGPGFDERLPLPGAAFHVVIRQRAVEAQAERAARAFGPQPQIDAVGAPRSVVSVSRRTSSLQSRSKNSWLVTVRRASVWPSCSYRKIRSMSLE